jgi:putative transposase
LLSQEGLPPEACKGSAELAQQNRKGAFREDRYHATAVQTGEHLVQCIVYMDLNMIRAEVVKHPSDWPHCRYKEIQNPPERYRLIDRKALMQLLGTKAATN